MEIEYWTQNAQKNWPENGGSVTLTTKCDRGILKWLDWVEIRGTAAKREINPTLYEDLTFTWKRKISSAISERSIYKEMSLNFNLMPLGYTEPDKATFGKKDAPSLSKCQIVGTFCVKISRFYWFSRWTGCTKRITSSLFMYLTTIQTYFDRLIFRLIRVPNAIFQPNTKIGTQKKC